MTKEARLDALRQRRHARVRRKVAGTPERPRLAVFRSNRHIVAQVIDDVAGQTIAAASTVEASLRAGATGNAEAAAKVGQNGGRMVLQDENITHQAGARERTFQQVVAEHQIGGHATG